MDLALRKEQFSIAYVRAVAAVAGFTVYRPEVDDDSVDLGLGARGGAGTVRSPRIELQLKCTAQPLARGERLAFSLKRKNYDDLRGTNLLVPRLLVVVVVPDRLDDWLMQDETQLSLRHCGYFCSLRNLPEHDTMSSVTIQIPRSQVFTVAAVQRMMDQIRRGEAP